MAPPRRPGYLPGTPNWPLKFVLSEMLERRATGRPDPDARRRGVRGMPGLPDRPGVRPAPRSVAPAPPSADPATKDPGAGDPGE